MATTFYWSTSTNNDIKDVAPSGSEIRIANVYRPLRKPVTRHKVEIPGRVGSWDFGGGVERDYTVSVDLIITGDRSSDVMACAEAVDTFLTGKEPLVFSDSTGTTHQAQIFSEITLTPEGPGNVARATLEFECDASS